MKKIFVFSTKGGDAIYYAMAEDGTVLGSHWCSDEWFAPNDLGVEEGSRPDRHENYKKHYPDGYEMEFVPTKNVKSHAGIQEAIRLNKEQGEKAKSQNKNKEDGNDKEKELEKRVS